MQCQRLKRLKLHIIVNQQSFIFDGLGVLASIMCINSMGLPYAKGMYLLIMCLLSEVKCYAIFPLCRYLVGQRLVNYIHHATSHDRTPGTDTAGS